MTMSLKPPATARLLHTSRVHQFGLFVLLCLGLLPGFGCRNSSEHRTYYSNGWLETRTTPNGAIFEYSYDKSGRLTAVRYPGNSLQFAYDTSGNLVKAEDREGTVRLEWTEFNRISKVTYPHGQSVSYEFDPWGRIVLRRISGSHDVHYAYDILGRLVQVDGGIGRTEYAYGNGEIHRKLPNGIGSTYRYSVGGRLNSIVNRRESGDALSSFSYVYSPDDKIVQVDELTPQGENRLRYSYDLVGRLTEVNSSKSRVTYNYDSMGNRLLENRNGVVTQYSYDGSGRLARKGNISYKYDKNGNLVSQNDNDRHVTTNYLYDAADRLIAIWNGTRRIRYSYDALGNRIRREEGGKAIEFVNDLSYRLPQVIAEYDGSKALTCLYLYGSSRVASTKEGGRQQLYLTDGLGSIRQIVDAAGQVIRSINYDAFGEPDSPVELDQGQSFAFAGEDWDQDAGLLFLRARYYAPALGRFISRDPLRGNLANPQSQNRYIYARNDPINLRDPSGLQDDGGWGDWGGGDFTSYYPAPTVDPNINISAQSFVNNWDPNAQAQIQWPQQPSLGDQAKSFISQYADQMRSLGQDISIPLLGEAAGSGTVQNIATNGGRVLGALDLAHAVVDQNPMAATRAVLGLATSADGLGELSGPMTGAAAVQLGLETTLKLSGVPQEQIDIIKDQATQAALNTLTTDPTGFGDKIGSLLSTDMAKSAVTSGVINALGTSSAEVSWSTNAGSLPVGGIRLDKAAELTGNLGSITGAVYDPDSGRLILVGEKRSKLPPMRLDDLAVALRAAYAADPHEPAMTINPPPNNPLGPTMNVIFFANTQNTHFGSVMFEADRRMKAYSVGKDNLTKAPVQSNVAEYHNVMQLTSNSNRRNNPHLWSRFWLVPDRVALSISPDGRSLGFGQTKIRVKTETMRMVGGKLVQASGEKDETSEQFAQHFTDHYDDFSKESPVYGELKRLAQVAAVAKWLKEARIPVDFRWVDTVSSEPFQTPQTTPSVTNLQSRDWRAANGNHTETHRVFGGTELAVPLVFRPNSTQVQGLETAVLKALKSSSTKGSFDVPIRGATLQAISIFITPKPALGSFLTAQADLRVGTPGVDMVSLTRRYTSFHNATTAFGRSWSLDLPHLYFQSNSPKDKINFIGVAKSANTQVQDQTFQLADDLGLVNLWFTEHFIDQEWRRVGFRGPGTVGVYRGLYPNHDGTYSLIRRNGEQMRFNREGQLVETVRNGILTRNVYDKTHGRLIETSTASNPMRQLWIRLHYDESGRIDRAQTSTGGHMQYTYDDNGDLTSVSGEGYSYGYTYDNDHVLVSASTNGGTLFRNQYDPTGKLIRQLDGDGKTLSEHHVEEDSSGRTHITTFMRGTRKSHTYDDQMRLIAATDTIGNSVSYSYFDDGELRKVETTNSEGAKEVTEISTDRREIRFTDFRKITRELKCDVSGRPAQLLINGEVRVRYTYDAEGRLTILDYGGSREHFGYDGNGRLATRAIEAGNPGYGETGMQLLVYRYNSNQRAVVGTPGSPERTPTIQTDNPIVLSVGSYNTVETDSEGRVTRIHGTEGAFASVVYGHDQILSAIEIHEGSSVAECRFDRGHISEIKSFADGHTRFRRNAEGNVLGVSDPYGTNISYRYNSKGLLETIIPPVGTQISFTYDEHKRVVWIKD
jgi:RHS repeat-associated protein